MKTAGIICEYNPFHRGHERHIAMTRKALGGDAYIVCAMSGNYVQRGDAAVFNKHARAKMAVLCGADLVIDIPAAYALQSAQKFAEAGVYLLDALGICGYLSFGSESGSIKALKAAAAAAASIDAQPIIKDALSKGLPYAAAQQRASDMLLGPDAEISKSPNNVLGIEYLKALAHSRSAMRPVTVRRTGGEHDSDTGLCASAIRKQLAAGTVPIEHMCSASASVIGQEISDGRGPVFLSNLEQAVMSRLRNLQNFDNIPGAADGLAGRFLRYAPRCADTAQLLETVKTKRFAMSRIRRVLMCAALGITCDDILNPPPYIQALAMNGRGTEILNGVKPALPVITKPASVRRLGGDALRLFELESRAADFYALGYPNQELRTAGSLWRTSPVVV